MTRTSFVFSWPGWIAVKRRAYSLTRSDVCLFGCVSAFSRLMVAQPSIDYRPWPNVCASQEDGINEHVKRAPSIHSEPMHIHSSQPPSPTVWVIRLRVRGFGPPSHEPAFGQRASKHNVKIELSKLCCCFGLCFKGILAVHVFPISYM